MGVHYMSGFQDVFGYYALNGLNNTAMGKVDAANADAVRVVVSWDAVEPVDGGALHWTQSGPAFHQKFDLALVRAKAQELGLQVLPIVVGAPSWLGAARAPCQPSWLTDNDPETNTAYYPLPSAASRYAEFAQRVVEFFDACGVITAVEVWNEPNDRGSGVRIADPSHWDSLVTATISQLKAAYPPVAPSTRSRITVVSGGLLVNRGPEANWRDYVDVVCRQCDHFGLGIHPYDLRIEDWIDDPNVPENRAHVDEIADAIAARVLDLYDDVEDYLLAAHGIAIQDLWVTETGATSRFPLEEDGQERAIRKIFGDLGLDSRPRCKAGFAYRLFPNNEAGKEGPGSTFNRYSTLNSDWSAKAAHTRLGMVWA